MSIQTGFTLPKRTIRVKICNFLSRVTLKFDGWPWKTIRHLFYATSSFVYHLKAMGEFKVELQSGNSQFGSKSAGFFSRVTFKFDGWPWKNNRAPLLCCIKLCASFHSHQWIQTGVAVRKQPFRVKIGNFFVPCDLEIWRMTLKNNRVPLLCHIKLCASFHRHMWIQTGVTVRKRLNWVDLYDFDLWPWPFARTSLLSMVIAPENFMMIRCWEHSENDGTYGQTSPFLKYGY